MVKKIIDNGFSINPSLYTVRDTIMQYPITLQFTPSIKFVPLIITVIQKTTKKIFIILFSNKLSRKSTLVSSKKI